MAKKLEEVLKKTMPIIPQDEWEVFFRIIHESLQTKLQIKITVFDD